jgi:hypothetical protein
MTGSEFPALTVFLDASRTCRLRFQRQPGDVLHVALLLPEATGPHLLVRLLRHLRITVDAQEVSLLCQNHHQARGQVNLARRSKKQLAVWLNQQCWMQGTLDAGLTPLHLLLTVSELRIIGEFEAGRPYLRCAGVDARGLIFSDFHTHSSGELPGSDLLAIAAGHGLAYPVRLLAEIGCAGRMVDGLARQRVKRVIFPPLRDEEAHLPAQEDAIAVADLPNKVRKRLAAAMDAPFDRQCTFADMERTCYRFRYPLAKQPELLVPTLMKIGENYRRQGVRYAEITMAGIERPENLAAIHHAVPRVRQKYGVDLRFLVGIPRTLSRAELHPLIEKTKLLAESPYIVGADIIGYETNKTSHLMDELQSLARWIHRGPHREFTIRVHAGENAKNPDNVYEVLKLANEFSVRVRVGHALHGLDAKSLTLAAQLAEQKLVVLEFNPDSNIALNNMDRLEQIPFEPCRRFGIDYVLGTDGSGIYVTSAEQLGLAAESGLLDAEGQQWLRASQETLIARQRAYSADKEIRLQRRYPDFPSQVDAFVEQLADACQRVRSPAYGLPAERTPVVLREHLPVELVSSAEVSSGFQGLTPVVLAGASGNSWARMSAPSQRETAIAVDLMARVLDPGKVMFVHGRSKEKGIVAELARALTARGGTPFTVLGMITVEHWNELLGERMRSLAPHLTHAELIHRGFLYVPEALVRLATSRHGVVVAAGGAAFTRDIVLLAKQSDLPVFLLRCAEGASLDKARMMPESAVENAYDLVCALHRKRPELFLAPLTEDFLSDAYAASVAAVERISPEHTPPGTGIQRVSRL